ncbi:MAG: SEC-C domain-containing protein [Methanomicrobia archaeon]|nr:SEC-C domain-containing protein [Methanomicrobia archaeon]
MKQPVNLYFQKTTNYPARRAALRALIERIREKMRNAEVDSSSANQSKHKKIGRNDPCPCGSGKKYRNVVVAERFICVDQMPWQIRYQRVPAPLP